MEAQGIRMQVSLDSPSWVNTDLNWLLSALAFSKGDTTMPDAVLSEATPVELCLRLFMKLQKGFVLWDDKFSPTLQRCSLRAFLRLRSSDLRSSS